MFEFGAIVFLAAAFPGTLSYASTYALVRPWRLRSCPHGSAV